MGVLTPALVGGLGWLLGPLSASPAAAPRGHHLHEQGAELRVNRGQVGLWPRPQGTHHELHGLG